MSFWDEAVVLRFDDASGVYTLLVLITLLMIKRRRILSLFVDGVI